MEDFGLIKVASEARRRGEGRGERAGGGTQARPDPQARFDCKERGIKDGMGWDGMRDENNLQGLEAAIACAGEWACECVGAGSK